MNHTTFLLLLLTASLLPQLQAARILGVIPSPSFSHQVAFRPIWTALAKRGHELVILTTDPMHDPTLRTLREIDLHRAYDNFTLEGLQSMNVIQQAQAITRISDIVFEEEMRHPEVVALLNNKTEHFDLVVFESLYPVLAAWGWRFQCPHIAVVSMDAPFFGHLMMGNPLSPALYPDLFFNLTPPFNFLERVESLIIYVVNALMSRLVGNENIHQQAQKYFGNDIPRIEDIWGNISMLFINTHPLFHAVRPLTPTTIEIGGGMHLNEPKLLPNDLQEFLDGATNGAIYFSLGTNVKSHWIGERLMDVFLAALSELPYRVLWKFDAEVADLPPNVKTIKWGPQQDILRHPNVKLMIMQGGQQSTEESVMLKVPLVVIPFFGDQKGSAQKTVKKGFGIELDRNTLTKEGFIAGINEVLMNSRYREAVETVSELVKDQPMTGVEKAVWWIEYVIRNKGAKHLKSKAINVPLYQILYLDLLVVIFAIYYFVKFGIKFVVQYFRQNSARYLKLKTQ